MPLVDAGAKWQGVQKDAANLLVWVEAGSGSHPVEHDDQRGSLIALLGKKIHYPLAKQRSRTVKADIAGFALSLLRSKCLLVSNVSTE